MADTPKFFKAVAGITDGMVHHSEGEVFASTESLDAHYAASGGKASDGTTVLYEPASQDDFNAYTKATSVSTEAQVNDDGSVPLGVGAPSGGDVVGGDAYENITSEDVADGPKVTLLDDGTPVVVKADESVDSAVKAAEADRKDGAPSGSVTASSAAAAAPSTSPASAGTTSATDGSTAAGPSK